MKTNKFLQFFRRGAFFAQILFIFVIGVNLATAQTTEFTYQGRLTDGAVVANANYDFEFQLYAAPTGGAPIGTRTRLGVPVINGVFTVRLDFLPSAFPGTDRFLEIAVKPAGSPNPFTILNSRQPITYAPQAFRSLSAAQADLALNSNKLGGIDANQFVTGQVVRSLNGLTDNVTLAAGSNITITPTGNTLTIASTGGGSGGILNQTTLQSGANFNIDGTGTANIVNAATQYNLGGNRVLITPTATNIFVGRNAGNPTVTGGDNSFVGTSAGSSNTTGFNNSFIGAFAGKNNTTGSFNSFVGTNAGNTNTTGGNNTVIGKDAMSVRATSALPPPSAQKQSFPPVTQSRSAEATAVILLSFPVC